MSYSMKACAGIVVGLLSCAITAHPQQTPTPGGGVYRVGGGVSAPSVIFAADPEYSKEARKAKYEGVCILSLIVTPEGNTRDIRVASPLGMGLDEKAVEAVKRWKFQPSMLNGKPVAVAINIKVDFRLAR